MALPSEEAGPAPAAVNSEGGVSQLRDPLIKRNFPDPDLLLHEGTYYAYATNHNLNNVQVATSKNLTDWEVLTIDALPNLPKWILEGNTWAPEVSSWPDGSFRMYFTARNAAFPKQCIGVATADNPLGPFEVQGNQMLVCPENLGGAIDAAVFFEEEIPYLIWKNDGNCCGIQTDLFIQQLSTDGLTLISEPVSLLSTSESWEGILIEAPTLVKREGRYHLFYSANDYYSQYYAVGHASSADLMGPYIKSDGPLLSSEILKDKVIGPGGQDLIQDQYGNWKIFFHGWNISKSARYMYSLDMQDVGWPE
jgi:beta-xylosidase